MRANEIYPLKVNRFSAELKDNPYIAMYIICSNMEKLDET